MTTHGDRIGRGLGAVLRLLFKLAFSAVAIAIPLLGGWAASSLAAASGGPLWAAILAAVAAFPVLPLVWEGIARARSRGKERILTTWDRLVLRTLAINVLFVGGLLFFGPGALFGALSTRGDWMLDGQEGESAQWMRGALFGAADHMEWLFEATYENEFADFVDEDGAADVTGDLKAGDIDERAGRESDDAGDRSPTAPTDPNVLPAWPLHAELAESVGQVPDHLQTIEDIGYFLRRAEPNDWRRAKAIHDFVADRVAYDAPALRDNTIGPQDALTVLRAGQGVCAGYANLFHALAGAAGLQSVVVVGDTRDEHGAIAGGNGHAWNAVELDDGWYLLDATWDAGTVDGRTYTKAYKTDWLFTPPAVFIETHRPRDPRWQLLDAPLSRGDFARQPMLRPRFHRHGFVMVEPTRARSEVRGRFDVVVENPRGHFLRARWKPGSAGECETLVEGDRLRARCELDQAGVHTVKLFANLEPYGAFDWVGSLEVVSR